MAPGWKGKRGQQHCLSQEEQIRHYARSHLDQEHPSLRSHLSYPQRLPRPRGSPSICAPALCFLAVSHCKQHPCLPHLHITELSWRVTDVTDQSPSRRLWPTICPLTSHSIKFPVAGSPTSPNLWNLFLWSFRMLSILLWLAYKARSVFRQPHAIPDSHRWVVTLSSGFT